MSRAICFDETQHLLNVRTPTMFSDMFSSAKTLWHVTCAALIVHIWALNIHVQFVIDLIHDNASSAVV